MSCFCHVEYPDTPSSVHWKESIEEYDPKPVNQHFSYPKTGIYSIRDELQEVDLGIAISYGEMN